MFLSFNRNLQIGFGFSILMLVVVGFVSFRTVNDLLDSNRAVEHSNLIMQKLEKAISLMKDAETGQRGYLLTNQKVFLEPYNGAYSQATGLIDQAAALTKDNSVQQNNLRLIKQVIRQRLTILQQLINQREQGKSIVASDFLAGKSAMDALRLSINKAEAEEQGLLDKRIYTLNHYTFIAPLFIGIAILLGVIIAILSYIKVIRDTNEKERLHTELEFKEQETAAFNEELTAANEELVSTNEELVEAREELATLYRSLEEKIIQRTMALSESEAEAQALNEELTAINEELAATNEEMLTTNEDLAESERKLQQYIAEISVAKSRAEKNEQIFHSIAMNIPGSLIVVIGKDHRFIAIEGDLKSKMGYITENYANAMPAEVSSPERYEADKPLYERALNGEQFRLERQNLAGDDFRVDFVPLKDEQGDIYAALAITLEITAIKKAEERSAKLAAIVESSDDAIISKTLDGIITSWNRSAERIFGYPESEMIGQPILKLIPEDRWNEETRIIAQLKKGERVEHFETKRLTSQGKLIDFSLTISPIRDAEGKVTGVSKIARDITEKKQDELRKNDFIGMVSHELKTPLTSLSALIQVLNQKLENSADSFIPSALARANTQVKKMTTMINGFLNISRLESGKILIEKQNFKLDELLKEMVDEARLIVTGHVLTFEPCENTPIYADRDKIGSVISNLINNAIKYSPNGKLVTIICKRTGSEVLVSIKDEGIGIKATDLGKLFQRYYRVSSNHTQHISGFGIGLYLSAEIIEHHGGKIWAESESGTGSTFYFTLPIA